MSAAEPPFSAYQYEIYAAGLSGQRPSLPASGAEWERRFRERVAPRGLRLHRRRRRLRGHDARKPGGVPPLAGRAADAARRDARDLRVRLFDDELRAPVLIAPIGVQGIVHEEGELATARAAGEEGVRAVLRGFLADLDLTLALSGHRSVAELSPDVLQPASVSSSQS